MISIIKYRIALLLGQLVSFLSQKLKRGTGEQIAGRVITAISSNAISIAAKNKEIIVVSATNGKTSITRLIASAIKEQYGSVITNALGANQKAGIISALISKENKDAKYCVLEVDERSLPGIFDDLNPKILLLGNLSRDQLDRFGEVNSIATSWKKMLTTSNAHVIANACDANIVFATLDLQAENISYVDIETNWHDDANTCNICGSLLKWDDNNFECTNCDFKKPTNLVYTKLYESIIEKNLSLPGRWNYNNAKLALCALDKIGVDSNSISNAWPDVKDVSGRNAIFDINNNRALQLFLAKNPAGYNEMLKHISNEISKSKNPESIATIFAFNCNIADGKDPSWLYDVRFEDFNINNCYVFGERATDIRLRLEIAEKNVESFNNLDQILNNFSNDIEKYYLIASYTQFHKLSKTLPKKYELEIQDKKDELVK